MPFANGDGRKQTARGHSCSLANCTHPRRCHADICLFSSRRFI